MRCLGLVAALTLSSLPLAVLTSYPSEVIAAEKDKKAPDSAFVKVTLTKGDQKLVHPGFRLVEQEEGVFVIELDDKSHEITVVLHDVADTKFKIHVDYSIDGASQLSRDLEAEVGKPVQLDKGETKLAISLDPRGDQDKSRKDEDKLDKPKGDDPLGDM